ncbi:MAG: LAGLIDADG family homing endonuclease [Candidatus Microgenomates bacterium]|jgi:hypothetical protein
MLRKPRKHFSCNLLPRTDPRYIIWLNSLKKKRRCEPWNKSKTRFTDKRIKKISETFLRKKIDNFSNWRINARNSGLIPNPNRSFKHSKELAFLIGMTLGDGCLQKISRTESLRITLGSNRPLLIAYTANIVGKVINKKPSVIKRNCSNCFNVTLYQNNLSKRLEVPLGARKNLKIMLPNWIWSKKSFLVSALSGLFEAEGSFSIHKPTYTYNFSFSNVNVSLLDEVEKALKLLNFHPERRSKEVRLRKKEEALRFEKLISFRNYPLI